MTAQDQIARLAITLDDVKPPVRRRIEVPLSIRLDRLHRVFQIVMGWEDYHLYEFRIGRDIRYGIPDPDWDFPGSSPRSAKQTTLGCDPSILKRSRSFGNSWRILARRRWRGEFRSLGISRRWCAWRLCGARF